MVGDAWLILPTYNEADNLEPLLAELLPALAAAVPGRHRVLIVDDASPDGTGRIADRLAGELDAVEVLHRPGKAGLGVAYVAGMRRALRAGADLVIEMDADFSHDPGDLLALVGAVTGGGADLALGSRYVPGGEVLDWSRMRRIVSRGGSRYAQTVLGLDVRDLTGGMKCFRREVLEAIDLSGVRAHGYAFQVEVTYRAVRAGFRVQEVPIRFRDRRAGASKMSARVALEAAWLVPALRLAAPGPDRRPDRERGLGLRVHGPRPQG